MYEYVLLQVNYIKARGLGGAMVWAMDLDDFKGSCGYGKSPLMSKITSMLTDGSSVPPTQPTSSESTTTTTPKPTTSTPASTTASPTANPTTAMPTTSTAASTTSVATSSPGDCGRKF